MKMYENISVSILKEFLKKKERQKKAYYTTYLLEKKKVLYNPVEDEPFHEYMEVYKYMNA